LPSAAVLLWSALELTRQRRWRAILITSALFGLWHVAPTLHTMSDNPAYGGLTGGVAGPALVVLGNIGVTFIGGLVFGWLRVWSKSLIAPVMAHASVDGLALTVAWFTVHHGSL
jgi:membrane protease YdiL (CAAX protease family)